MILLRIFKNNRATGTGAIILLLFLIYVPSFISVFGTGGGSQLTAQTGMPFYTLIFGAIHKLPFLNHFVAMLIMMLISYMLIRIGVRDQLLSQRSLMPAIFFILFAASLPAAREVSPELIASIFYLICFIILFEVQDKKPDTLSIFSASLILVLGSMFSLKLIWFVPLIWVSLWTMRKTTLRELFYPVVAFMVLFLFLFTWYWGLRDNGQAFRTLIVENISFTGGFQMYHFSTYILYAYIVLLVGIASIQMINRFQSMKTSVQNIYQVLFFMFLAGTIYFIFISRFNPGALVFISFPVSFVLSSFFHRKKSPWIHEVAMWILVGLVVYAQVMV